MAKQQAEATKVAEPELQPEPTPAPEPEPKAADAPPPVPVAAAAEVQEAPERAEVVVVKRQRGGIRLNKDDLGKEVS